MTNQHSDSCHGGSAHICCAFQAQVAVGEVPMGPVPMGRQPLVCARCLCPRDMQSPSWAARGLRDRCQCWALRLDAPTSKGPCKMCLYTKNARYPHAEKKPCESADTGSAQRGSRARVSTARTFSIVSGETEPSTTNSTKHGSFRPFISFSA